MSLERKTNHLKQNFHVDAPNTVWVSDVTVLRLKETYHYLCVIIDLLSRKIVTYKVSQRNSTQLIISTFCSAYASRKPDTCLMFHSDQGSQYTSNTFRSLLERLQEVTQSLSRSGKPHDNAVAESFFSTFKKEEFYHSNYRSGKELH